PTAGGFSDGLLRVSPARTRLRSSAGAAFRVHSFLGNFGFLSVLHAACGVPDLWRGGRGGSLERWQAPVHQSPHALPGPLGAQALLEGNRRVVPYFLGQGL